MTCPFCKKDSFIEVSRVYGKPFYACHNKDCEKEAELMINVSDDNDPYYVGYFEMILAMNSMKETGLTEKEDPILLGNDKHE